MPIKTDTKNGLISNDVVIMNFSGVYDMEGFPHNKQYHWLDCRHLSGTDCYCDDEGKNALIKMIKRCPIPGAENGAYPPTLNGLIHPVLPLNWP